MVYEVKEKNETCIFSLCASHAFVYSGGYDRHQSDFMAGLRGHLRKSTYKALVFSITEILVSTFIFKSQKYVLYCRKDVTMLDEENARS